MFSSKSAIIGLIYVEIASNEYYVRLWVVYLGAALAMSIIYSLLFVTSIIRRIRLIDSLGEIDTMTYKVALTTKNVNETQTAIESNSKEPVKEKN
ncbi:unnamed protein product [Caenorhabditis bovis]|uniref:Uncharacterized protein n=1 Tax=Caenorhabditis bovis TaxID=2654633 RepID=A0A8S1F366_9PELO|nr:unnamed protein product [Caenorhabditis bovis]